MSVYKRGDKWWYKICFEGQIIRESTKSKSKTLAIGAEKARRRELEETYNNIPKSKRAKLFSLAADEWLVKRFPHVAPKTVELYRLALSHLKPRFGRRLLTDISADDIARYQGERLGKGLSNRTVNLEVGVLRSILIKHDRNFWSEVAKGFEFLPEREDIGRALTQDEEARLLRAASDRMFSGYHIYPIVCLALNTAMRSQEIRTMQWSQIDLNQRTIRVGKSKTVAGSGRVIPLNQPAWAVLEHWRARFPNAQATDYIFPACENRRVDPTKPIKSFRTAWRNALRLAALKCRFHDLRHTCISRLGEGQNSDQAIMAIAGHVSRRMMERYSHIGMDAKRKAVEALSRPVFEEAGAQKVAQSRESKKEPLPN